MSSRQLRKLQQQRELEKARALDIQEESSDEGEDIGPPGTAAKPRPNLFAALGGEDEDQDDEAAAEDDGGDDADENHEAQQEEVIQTQPQASSKKSKKKKKKKSKAAETVPAETPENDEDEIDKAMKDLGLATGDPSQAATQSDAVGGRGPATRLNELLGINLYHLRPVNEMRNLFGRDVIESANAEEQRQQQENLRRNRTRGPVIRDVDLETYLRGPPGAPKLPEVSLRRNIFVQGREHWPRQTAGGLTMKQVGSGDADGSTEYAYVHEKQYDDMQALFFACVQIGDPNRMIQLLMQAPKQDQNMALAGELCERALFTFGRVTTSTFRQDVEHGRARLDFRRPENRQFWLAGYHFLKSLIRKGTYRTALEWAKLLHAIDPQGDPYAMKHFIHFLAIRAYESRWLIDFLESQSGNDADGGAEYLRQTLVLAKLQAGDVDGARQDLAQGIQRLPWLYCALFQDLNLDAPPSIWGTSADSNARSFWTKLYIYQTKDLWNNTQATSLLQDVAKSLNKVDTSNLPQDDAPPGLGPTRLAYLEGQTSLLAVAPRALLESQPNYEFDPLPPPEKDNIFTSEGTQLPWRDDQQRRQTHGRDAALLARVQDMLAAHEAQIGAGGNQAGNAFLGQDEDEDDDEIRALREADDEELRHDIEAHMGRGGEPGILATLMQMLGVGRSAGHSGDETAVNDDDRGDGESAPRQPPRSQQSTESTEDLPGAWPTDDDGDAGPTGQARDGST
ncbi:hypothetical protein PLIIFM63780_008639 [Purpureocillium lilacinum]|nr:hypothetical protein PLIIFM63780_008639 [Purpureocillium lilacinum]